MSKDFKKKVEDFVCENCGEEVVGDGYTNHCPKCLWSNHVDKTPGDRAVTCNGMMRPVRAEENGGEYSIIHRCEKCGYEKKNKISPNDNFDEVLKNH
ncbi:MAG: RNHCP domain-containing protein [Calditrichia bacterium]